METDIIEPYDHYHRSPATSYSDLWHFYRMILKHLKKGKSDRLKLLKREKISFLTSNAAIFLEQTNLKDGMMSIRAIRNLKM
jgi:hypothetical protein